MKCEKSEKRLLRSLPVERLQRGRYQPRQTFDQEALEELANSIKSAGLLQPVLVRLTKENIYEIVAGERRWRAAQLAGLKEIDCLINNYTDAQAAQASAVENLNRVDLNPIEISLMYKNLVKEFNYTHEELSAVLGICRSSVTNSLRLLNLDKRVQELLNKRELSEMHGIILAVLPAQQQYSLALKSVKMSWSSRQLDREVKKQGGKILVFNKKNTDVKLLENRLSDYLQCPVEIVTRGKKGYLKLNFYSLDILDGLFEKIGFQYE